MTTRAPALALCLLATASLATLTACRDCDVGWHELKTASLEIDAELEAVVGPGVRFDGDENRQYENLAVGTNGTVVAWGSEFHYDVTELFVEVFEIGAADLHAVVVREGSWWVVGDDGMMAVSADNGRKWAIVNLGITADLRAIVDTGLGLVAVGEDVIVVQAADGTWTSAPAPVGGWGSLRGAYHEGTRVYAVGLAGVIWSATDPSGVWEAQDVGVDADLFAIGKLYSSSHGEPDLIAVVGADGTFLTHRPGSGWTTMDIGTHEDLVGYSDGATLGAEGTVFEVDEDGAVTIVGNFVGVSALRVDPNWGDIVTLGDGGWVRIFAFDNCLTA